MPNPNHSTVYWSTIQNSNWHLYLAAISEGLCYVGSQDASFEQLSDYITAKFADHTLVEDDTQLEPYKSELLNYLSGRHTQFDIPIYTKGTPFQQAVWQALAEIPYSETRTYSDIANSIGKPSAVRAVGTAIGANPVLIAIPCHRVIGKNGSLTGYRGGMEMKRQLLELEAE